MARIEGVKCDGCGRTGGAEDAMPPKGWCSVVVASRNAARDVDLCPKCHTLSVAQVLALPRPATKTVAP